MNNCKIEETLLSIKSDLMNLTSQEDSIQVMKKYNIAFLGANLNLVNSLELYHYLNHQHLIDLTLSEFVELMPKVCAKLNMKYDPYVSATDLTNNKIAGYFIHLF